MRSLIFFIFTISSVLSFAASDSETKKSYIEDIFIWRMSDELKLTASEEKKFTAIHKELNKRKAELNKEIQETTQNLPQQPTEAQLGKLRQAIKNYNQISLDEFDLMKKLLGLKRFAAYLQIKSELTNKVKLLLSGAGSDSNSGSGEKAGQDKNPKDKKQQDAKLPPPQVIIEK